MNGELFSQGGKVTNSYINDVE